MRFIGLWRLRSLVASRFGFIVRPSEGSCIQHIKGFGASAEIATAAKPQSEALEKGEGQEPPALPVRDNQPGGPPPSPSIFDSFDAELSTTLKNAFPSSEPLQLAWAIRARSQVLVERLHETHYRVIYGSQIEAIRGLNQRGEVEISEGRQLYTRVAEMFPELYSRITFESWYGFLLTIGYAERIGHNMVRITPLGKSFLIWMDERGIFEGKLG
jgi:hypothetical protein